MMLRPDLSRLLTLSSSQHPHGNEWLSAASGLVSINGHAYVIADDEHHLAHFRLPTAGARDTPLTLVQLFEGVLPKDKHERKKAKPDLESLALLPPMARYPHGALLTLGSGSKTHRSQARLLPLDERGKLSGELVAIDASEWYRPLKALFDDLNIEGAFVAMDHLYLLQRGNKGDSPSACLLFPLEQVTAWLQRKRKQPPRLAEQIILDFGKVDGVPICPTDGIALPGGGWVFAAVAENTDESYTDGPCLASFIGVMDSRNQLCTLHRLQGDPKVEGIALATTPRRAGKLALWMVTDADDPSQPAQLLKVDMDLT
jgi:hypothetical protein